MHNIPTFKQMIQCPECRLDLIEQNDKYCCKKCNHNFGYIDEILNLLPKKDNTFRDIEQQFWDQAYTAEENRDTENRNFDFHHHFRRPLINLPAGSAIIELGCGTRADSLEIAQTAKHVVATDISPIALSKAKRLAQRMNISNFIEFVLAQAEKLPFKDDTFDAALMAASFHHIENPIEGLKEIKRVVKPGGLIIFGVEPNSWPYKTIYKALNPIKKYIRKKRSRNFDSIADDSTEGFSKGDLKKMLNNANLKIVEIKPVKFLLEYYDSYSRLKQRLIKKPAPASKAIQQSLNSIDNIIARVPIINNFPWHWNIICRVKKQAN